jgi:hypothetical protein
MMAFIMTKFHRAFHNRSTKVADCFHGKHSAPMSDFHFDYGVADGDGPGEVSDSSGLVATVASGEAVGLGTAVSVFRSQATSDAAAAKMQMYVFIYLFEMDSKHDKCCVLNEKILQ